MQLIIVESPTKANSIQKYLGAENYTVISTKGHIYETLDSNVSGLGYDFENHKILYRVTLDKKKLATQIQNLANTATSIFLATDPDREGEAIASHLWDLITASNQSKAQRIRLYEINKTAVEQALKNPTQIDLHLVQAQETRMLFDKIIGYCLSRVVQKKIFSPSVGRIQSVLLNLICERESQIANFISQQYFTICFQSPFLIKLVKTLTNPNGEFADLASAQTAVADLIPAEFFLHSKTLKTLPTFPSPVLTTASFLQLAASRLHINANNATMIAQQLFEGIEINHQPVGLITYPRTDSTRISDDFQLQIKNYILDHFGEKYLGKTLQTTKAKFSQEAHEAIRPSDLSLTPDSLKSQLKPEVYLIYKLIYETTIASFMSPKQTQQITCEFTNKETTWRTTAQRVVFDGFTKLIHQPSDSEAETNNAQFDQLTSLIEKENYQFDQLVFNEHWTNPPFRYNQARLIKWMEQQGIGRPSTYVRLLSKIIGNDYLIAHGRRYYASLRGNFTNQTIQQYFQEVINIPFTTQMEKTLDELVNDQHDPKQLITEFYQKVMLLQKTGFSEIPFQFAILLQVTCPKCKEGQLQAGYSVRRHKEFICCTRAVNRECDYVEFHRHPLTMCSILNKSCPECKIGYLQRLFDKTKVSVRLICDRHPDCSYEIDAPTKEIKSIININD